MANASDPMPLLVGSTTVSAIAAASAASTAFPPASNMRSPACAASGCDVATTFRAITGARCDAYGNSYSKGVIRSLGHLVIDWSLRLGHSGLITQICRRSLVRAKRTDVFPPVAVGYVCLGRKPQAHLIPSPAALEDQAEHVVALDPAGEYPRLAFLKSRRRKLLLQHFVIRRYTELRRAESLHESHGFDRRDLDGRGHTGA